MNHTISPADQDTDTEAIRHVASSRFRFSDILAAGVGSMTRRGARSVLSALGASIGIAALVAVLGLSDSSRAELSDRLDRLGTNLLVVTAGQGFGTETASLDTDAAARISHIGAVNEAAAGDAIRSRRDDRGAASSAAQSARIDSRPSRGRARVRRARWRSSTRSAWPRISTAP